MKTLELVLVHGKCHMNVSQEIFKYSRIFQNILPAHELTQALLISLFQYGKFRSFLGQLKIYPFPEASPDLQVGSGISFLSTPSHMVCLSFPTLSSSWSHWPICEA